MRTAIKHAWRTLTKNQFYSFLNIAGLCLAAVCGIFIYQFITYEKSYDSFHDESETIYRVASFYGDRSNPLDGDAMNCAPFGPAIKADLASVTDFVRLSPEYSRVVVQNGDRQFEEETVYYADNSFFDVFNYKLIAGDFSSALVEPQTVVLTLEAAERYFGSRSDWKEDPVGKTLKVNSSIDVEVTGIMEPMPENTHLKFGVLVSFPSFLAWNGDPTQEWHWNDFYTYIKTQPGVSQEVLQAQVDEFGDRKHANDGAGVHKTYLVQAVEDIHLQSKLPYEPEPGGSPAALRILYFIGLFIVLIAWANYINLATAKARDRVQEVGLRKVLGASNGGLFIQFLAETLILNLTAGLLAFVCIHFLQPTVNNLVGYDLSVLPGMFSTTIYLLLSSVLLGTLIAGIYPAYSMLKTSAHQSVEQKDSKVEWLRKGLVVFQYAASVVLIISTMVILKQLDFMQSIDLGFTPEQKLVLKAPTEQVDSVEKVLFNTFRNEAINYSNVQSVAASSAIPGKYYLDLNVWGGIALEGSSEEDFSSITNYQIDDEYMEIYGLEVLAGEPFSRAIATDDGDLAISESAVSALGLASPQDAIGKRVRYGNDNNIRSIRSVFSDYHHKSPRHTIEPLILWNNPGNILYYTVQLNNMDRADMSQIVTDLKQTWHGVAPNTPFQYFFFDEQFNQQYEADQRLARIVLILSVFAMLIACLGLFGLTSYMIAVKRREIGIRKVLGATVENVVKGLSINYLKLVGIACLLGVPLALYLSNNWLEGFAYRTPIGPGVLIIAAVITLLIALATVSSLTVRAAMANPADVINNE